MSRAEQMGSAVCVLGTSRPARPTAALLEPVSGKLRWERGGFALGRRAWPAQPSGSHRREAGQSPDRAQGVLGGGLREEGET